MSGSLPQRCLAEVAGTALLVGIGTGAIVAGARAGGVAQWMIAVAWFAAVAVPVFAFARVSGAHLNPAVSLGLVLDRRLPRGEFLPYVAAQFLGAFAGSAVVWALLGDSAHLGATVPHGIALAGVFLLEFALTGALVLAVLALCRWEGNAARVGLLLPPLVVGVSTFVIGPWTGSSLNPARSVGPAVLSQTFDGLWVYLLATLLAAVTVASLVRRLTRIPERTAPSS